MKVGRRYSFEASHSLPGVPGWHKQHGHAYTIDVEAEGEAPFAADMEQWDARIAVFSISATNLDIHFKPSTVEQIAQTLLAELNGASVVSVREDDDRWARAER